ncbi:hypothetical protein W97_08471 [Coniosporium apollinis CBS 100218]|uniref:Myb-like domain-containing protein n=1 Tax=Coniosporium apollinis (strain CBS 100218) TaxID=1168221 RepID=R7Z4W7_CONA1|nr:uncharacterized protein W97_08471 [Coniosporium apollinis CBS 100218]EON69212.1 hypothetical protein W97_08471 [Coniosporium apollinis CBS 100218]
MEDTTTDEPNRAAELVSEAAPKFTSVNNASDLTPPKVKDEEAHEDTPAAIPVTPKKRASVSKKKDDEADDDDESPKKKTKGTPRQRKAPAAKPAESTAIATSVDELSQADKVLLKMKEEGKPWAEINDMWEMITGKKPAKSTLPNRYARLKANIEAVKEDDKPKLFEAKKTVEERFEREKWNQIAAAMKELGTDDYTGAFLQKQFKKLQDAGAATAAAANTTAADDDTTPAPAE